MLKEILKSFKVRGGVLPKFVLTACMVLTLPSCSATEERVETEKIYVNGTPIHDPFESANRAVFSFNEGLNTVLINPVIESYRFIVPKPVRTGFSNFLTHLDSPVHLANQTLQGDLPGASNVLKRAIINTFIGFGGVYDVAGAEGIEHEPEDFGQTLAVWGVGNGPYVVVPVLGPSTLRDYVGFAVDSLADPLNLYLDNIDEEEWMYARAGADYFVLRAELIDVLKDLKATSVDYYAATRSTYYQRRNALINDSEEKENEGDIDYPEFEDF